MLIEEPQGVAGQTGEDKRDKADDSSDESLSRRAAVKKIQERIRQAKSKFDKDFERMKSNMDFVANIQWPGQTGTKCDKYIVNMTLQAVNRGVAALYARNPQVAAKRRPRLDFQLWDGNMETIIQTLMQVQMGMESGMPVPPEAMALINDFQQGRARQKLIDRVAKTLELVYQYQMDSQQPRFKTQMKQLVRRVRVCGVGYIKVWFERSKEDYALTQSETRLSTVDRIQRAKAILEKLEEEKITDTDAEVERLQQLVASLSPSPVDAEETSLGERLVFDFPRATSIIPDPATRTLKGWVGSKWIAEEYYYDLDFVNAYFETDISPSSDIKFFGPGGKPDEGQVMADAKVEMSRKVRLWEVYDLENKSTCIVCDGYKDYVCEPEPVEPCTRSFWNIFPVTFNDIEVEEGCKATIFPPSDVDLIEPIQREKNRIGWSLKRHRKANAPRYVYPDGAVTEEDLDRLESAEDQQFLPLKGLQPGTEPGKVLQALQTVPISPELYDSAPLQEDALLATGQQEANIGPAQPNVTATVGTIAEQSRMSVAASDVDGLDDSLTDVAQCGGEMLLQEMSIDTVRHIVGPGAVWPEQEKADFINELELEVVAASSGRPNKAIEIANWERIAPLLINSGANPQAIIRETVKRVDDRLEPAEFFPLPIPTASSPESDGGAPANNPSGKGRGNRANGKARQPLQPSSSGVAVPLAGA